MVTAVRFLRAFVGALLAVVAMMVTTVAITIIVATISIWWQDPSLSGREWQTLWWSMGAAVAGGLGVWAGIRFAHGKRRPGEPSAASFRLERTKSGRQERFLEAAGVYALFLVLAVELWYRVPGDPYRRVGQVAGWFVVIYLGMHLRVLLHELGHLGAGGLLGLSPWTLRVGMGPVLSRGQTHAGFQWEWRLRPGGGWGECLYSSEGAFRRERFCVVLGGPMADALLVTGGWLAWSYLGRPALLPPTPPGAAIIAADVLIFVTLAPALAGLVPHRVSVGDRVLHTDGWWLLKAFFLPADKIKGWMFAQGYARAQRLWGGDRKADALAIVEELRGRHPERTVTLLVFEGHLRRAIGDPARAATCFRQVLGEDAVMPAGRLRLRVDYASALAAAGDVEGARAWCAESLTHPSSKEERVELLDGFASLPLLHEGTRALLPDASGWCAEALTLDPDRITLRGTHGSLLVELDRCEEAWPILQGVLAATGSGQDRGICAFYLALAARRLGRTEEGRAYREQALRDCAVPVLLRRLAAELPAG